jgi:integrative and conjugative element protein (TIGR02256 family)
VKAWIAVQLAAQIAEEANSYELEETGGMLLGYWSGPGSVVITGTIGPGPEARRGRTWFLPDQRWQVAELADVYEASGRVTTYLGDWHTHPGGAPIPSRRDRRTLRAVRRSPAARAPQPLMLIIGPRADSRPFLWCLSRGRRPMRVDLTYVDECRQGWPLDG